MSIDAKYYKYLDTCIDPIRYKGINIKALTVKEIREEAFICYCLSVDPMEFNDITLMPLKRLDFILTIKNRKENNQVPIELVEKYETVISSYHYLIHMVFPEYVAIFGDPLNPKRKRAITFIEKSSLELYQEMKIDSYYFVTLSANEFEELADLILYQNAIDVSYKDIPPAMREEAERVRRHFERLNKGKSMDIERLIDIAFLELHDYETILKMPIRKFHNLIYNIEKRQSYEILKTGMYDSKNLSHWMQGGYDRNPYDGVWKKEDEITDKLKNF